MELQRVKKEVKTFGFIPYVNQKIAQEKENAIGITVILVMLGTVIASLSAALSIYKDISLGILFVTSVLAMGANIVALSQRPFKMIVWAFLMNILGNSFLLMYQLFHLWG